MKIERLLYFGTAPIAIPALKALHEDPGSEIVAVCTQPDRPKGRKRKLSPSPVKACALELGLPVVDAEKIGDAAEQLRDLKPDLAVVFAYGQYMPTKIFDLPEQGSINFHPSLLPKYRGASPIQSAMADGLVESGLSVIRVGKRMDAGDILKQEVVPIQPEDTGETMSERFATLAGEWVPGLLQVFREDQVSWTPQEESEATECGKIQKGDGDVDWSLPAETLWHRIRAFQPWPGATFLDLHGQMIKIQEVTLLEHQGAPGTVLELGTKGPVIACGQGALQLRTLQPPGKKPMKGADFLNGHDWEPGMQLPVSWERG